MITASTAWIEAQDARKHPLAPEGFVRIRYESGDTEAQQDMSETDNGHISISDPRSITDGIEGTMRSFASLELHAWGLDGSCEVVDEMIDGYVSSQISDNTGYFAEAPVISAVFSTVHYTLLEGVTIDFGTEFATAYKLEAFNGSALVSSVTVVNNTKSNAPINMDFAGYDRLDLTIYSWGYPHHRARITDWFMALVYYIEKQELTRYEHTQTGDLLSAELPKNEIVFSVDNVRGEFNPDNPAGRFKYLQERQRVEVTYGFDINADGNIEWVKGGTFYLSEWETPANGLEATLTARDILLYLQDEIFVGNVSGTLKQIAQAVVDFYNLPPLRDGTLPYYFDDRLDMYTASISSGLGSGIDSSGGEVGSSVINESLYLDDSGGSVSADYTGADILQMVANAAHCVMYQDRNGVLRIEPMKDGLTGLEINNHNGFTYPEYTIQPVLKSVDVNNGLGVYLLNDKGAIQTLNNDLITTEFQATQVAAWVAKILNLRNQLSGSFRIDPRFDVFDLVSVDTKFGSHNAVALTELKTTFTGSFRGEYRGRITDFEPWPTHLNEWYSAESVLDW